MKTLALITTLAAMAISSTAYAQISPGSNDPGVRTAPPVVKAPTAPTPVVVPAGE